MSVKTLLKIDEKLQLIYDYLKVLEENIKLNSERLEKLEKKVKKNK